MREFFCAVISLAVLAAAAFSLLYRAESKPEAADNRRESVRRANPSIEPSVKKEKEEEAVPARFKSYVMEAGETVAEVAERFHLKQGTVISASRINDMRRVKSGFRLYIPPEDGTVFFLSDGDEESALRFGGFMDRNKARLTEIRREPASIFPFSGAVLFIGQAEMETAEIEKIYGDYFYLPARGRVSSGFGERADPFDNKRRSFHGGLDIAADLRSAVRASRFGAVVKTGADSVYGNYIVIQHNENYQTFYGHLETISVKEGDKVMTGGRVGTVGNTGVSTGSHLHFAVYQDGDALDPLPLLNK